MQSSDHSDSADSAGEPGAGLSGLLADVKQLAGDAKNLAQAELAYQASRAKVAGSAAQGIAVAVVCAFVVAVFALGALTVGLLIALTPLVTAWGATAIVAGGLALVAVLFLLSALRKWRRLKQILAGDDAP